jgi:hypothetical protein
MSQATGIEDLDDPSFNPYIADDAMFGPRSTASVRASRGR